VEEFQELSGRAATVLKLKDGVTLRRVVLCREGEDLVVASSTGRVLRLTVNDANLPLMGRNAQGPMLMRLLPGERVVGAACGPAEEGSVLLASAGGQVKKLAVAELRRCQRGDLGQIGLRFEQRGDQLVDLCEGSAELVSARVGDTKSVRLATTDLTGEDPSGTGILLPLGASDELRELVPLLR
jgi:DNA gyrase subunit A